MKYKETKLLKFVTKAHELAKKLFLLIPASFPSILTHNTNT